MWLVLGVDLARPLPFTSPQTLWPPLRFPQWPLIFVLLILSQLSCPFFMKIRTLWIGCWFTLAISLRLQYSFTLPHPCNRIYLLLIIWKISARRSNASAVEPRIGLSQNHPKNLFNLTYPSQWEDSRRWLGGNNFGATKNNQPRPK